MFGCAASCFERARIYPCREQRRERRASAPEYGGSVGLQAHEKPPHHEYGCPILDARTVRVKGGKHRPRPIRLCAFVHISVKQNPQLRWVRHTAQQQPYDVVQVIAYIDNNFIVDCVGSPHWKATVLEACRNRLVRIVISPWSIYEIGKASIDKMNEAIRVAEELEPRWILERADLQLREFLHAWNDFWNGSRTEFSPIATLSEVQASFLRVSVQQIANYTLADYARVWQHPDAHTEAAAEFHRQERIAAWNRAFFSRGKLMPEVVRAIRMRYVARQMIVARSWQIPLDRIAARETRILRSSKLSTIVGFFVDFGGMEDMKAHQVEEAFTFHHWGTEAILNSHRLIDRFHATVALPYCDIFVTSDKELIKRSNLIKGQMRFSTAIVVSGAEFVDLLQEKLVKLAGSPGAGGAGTNH